MKNTEKFESPVGVLLFLLKSECFEGIWVVSVVFLNVKLY